MKQYKVKLDAFQGPLDLLLHLIKELEIDIYDIPMAKLTDQYMNYIQQMNELEINIASEYLVMASELLRIKSKMLLPEPPIEEYNEDPREELVTQLLEYQNYKMYAEELKQLKISAETFFVKAPNEFEEVYVDDSLSVSLSELLEAYNKVRQRVSVQAAEKSVVQRERYTHEDAISFLEHTFKNKRTLPLSNIFKKEDAPYKIVQVFLTLLELISLNAFKVKKIDDEISFTKVEEQLKWS